MDVMCYTFPRPHLGGYKKTILCEEGCISYQVHHQIHLQPHASVEPYEGKQGHRELTKLYHHYIYNKIPHILISHFLYK